MTNEIEIPNKFKEVEYNELRIPGVKNQSDLSLGANCQVFAYELLAYFNIYPPQFRSSELWNDKTYTKLVNNMKKLDILLYNKTLDSYGAHVGVYIGNEKVIHLSQSIGKPEIIDHKELLLRTKYKFFLGAKRVIKNSR